MEAKMQRRREAVFPPGAPKPMGPYSPGIRAGGFVFCSGTVGIDPATGKFVSADVAAQARQALLNLRGTLEAGGATLASVVKTTVFLVNLGEFATMNSVYAEFFPTDPPARSTIQVAALPGGAAVEIEAIALTTDD
jgi:2-iminobutanoate/2-iminopropanoate deaminase